MRKQVWGEGSTVLKVAWLVKSRVKQPGLPVSACVRLLPLGHAVLKNLTCIISWFLLWLCEFCKSVIVKLFKRIL